MVDATIDVYAPLTRMAPAPQEIKSAVTVCIVIDLPTPA